MICKCPTSDPCAHRDAPTPVDPAPPARRPLPPADAVHVAHMTALDDVVTAWSRTLPATAADAFAHHVAELRRVLARHAPEGTYCRHCGGNSNVIAWPCDDYADTVCAILRLASPTGTSPEPATISKETEQ